MGNAHAKWEIQCDCCTGNEFTFIRGRWIPSRYASLEPGNHSGLSWSGQLTPGELWLGTLKQGLVIGLVIAAAVLWAGSEAKRSAEQAAENMLHQQEAAASDD